MARWSDSRDRREDHGCSVCISKAIGLKGRLRCACLRLSPPSEASLNTQPSSLASPTPPLYPCSQPLCTCLPERTGCSQPSRHTVTVSFFVYECHTEHGESGALPLPAFLPSSFLTSLSFLLLHGLDVEETQSNIIMS